jgi:hypothetical protein
VPPDPLPIDRTIEFRTDPDPPFQTAGAQTAARMIKYQESTALLLFGGSMTDWRGPQSHRRKATRMTVSDKACHNPSSPAGQVESVGAFGVGLTHLTGWRRRFARWGVVALLAAPLLAALLVHLTR